MTSLSATSPFPLHNPGPISSNPNHSLSSVVETVLLAPRPANGELVVVLPGALCNGDGSLEGRSKNFNQIREAMEKNEITKVVIEYRDKKLTITFDYIIESDKTPAKKPDFSFEGWGIQGSCQEGLNAELHGT